MRGSVIRGTTPWKNSATGRPNARSVTPGIQRAACRSISEPFMRPPAAIFAPPDFSLPRFSRWRELKGPSVRLLEGNQLAVFHAGRSEKFEDQRRHGFRRVERFRAFAGHGLLPHTCTQGTG